MYQQILALKNKNEILCANIDCKHIMTEYEKSIMMKRPSRNIFCSNCKKHRYGISIIRCFGCGCRISYINSEFRFYCKQCRDKNRISHYIRVSDNKNCLVCNKKLIHKQTKFCCRNHCESFRSNREHPKQNCYYCGNELVRNKRRFCCRECWIGFQTLQRNKSIYDD